MFSGGEKEDRSSPDNGHSFGFIHLVSVYSFSLFPFISSSSSYSFRLRSTRKKKPFDPSQQTTFSAKRGLQGRRREEGGLGPVRLGCYGVMLVGPGSMQV